MSLLLLFFRAHGSQEQRSCPENSLLCHGGSAGKGEAQEHGAGVFGTAFREGPRPGAVPGTAAAGAAAGGGPGPGPGRSTPGRTEAWPRWGGRRSAQLRRARAGRSRQAGRSRTAAMGAAGLHRPHPSLR